MWSKSQKIFKNEKFLNDYKSCEKELIAFKEAHENFIKTKQGKSVLMSAFALEFAIKIMLLAMIIQKNLSKFCKIIQTKKNSI
ncbi:hypothetical protein CSQ_0112 [Campylobacter jejuni subsp. jejuni DFVF1099]|nr:hypothetical protein CSQ_0112 [Campylobacter jejuni subsp. jejuni DFVF1099]